MARTLMCEIVTPERILYTNEVEMVVATTPLGEIGVLPLHTPLVTTLAAGEVRLKFGSNPSDWEFFTTSGGYMQVHEDKVIILADQAVAASTIDVERERKARELIKKQLDELPKEAEEERAECIGDLNWCDLQLKVAEKAKS
ncbi:MAG: ATP synthase F1 subunit epsilon [Coriobacteriales bacterium]|nr:ATP synthase F1 subunit epsilon [Coriobacteriales bacterium]